MVSELSTAMAAPAPTVRELLASRRVDSLMHQLRGVEGSARVYGSLPIVAMSTYSKRRPRGAMLSRIAFQVHATRSHSRA